MDNYIITIGRQLGSGGSAMGRAIADRFGFQYIDKEVLIKAAERLNLSEESLKDIDEKSTSIWSILAQTTAYEVPYVADEWFVPTSSQLFRTQSEIMRESVAAGPCVIIGRCASYLFRNEENHFSIFLKADEEARIARLEKTLGGEMTRQQMIKLIEKEDRDRAKYYSFYTGQKWLDLTEYDMTLDTSKFSDENVRDILFNAITNRFPQLR